MALIWFFLSASSADLGKEICVCPTLGHHFLATSQYLSIAYYYYYYYFFHILGIHRLYRGTLVPDDDFGKLTIY